MNQFQLLRIAGGRIYEGSRIFPGEWRGGGEGGGQPFITKYKESILQKIDGR